MNDSKDFQNAQSIRNGNSHVTSRPMFPNTSDTWRGVEAFLRIAAPQRRAAKQVGHTWCIGERFLQIQMHHRQHLILKNCINGGQPLRNRFICLQRRIVKDQNEIKFWDASLDRQPKIQSSSVEETLQRIMEQTNNDCRFLISTLTRSLHQQPLLAVI